MGKFTPSDIQELSQYFHKVTNNVSTLPAYKDSGDSRLVTLTQGTKTGVYLYANNKIIQLGVGAVQTTNPNPVGGGGGFVGGGSGSQALIIKTVTLVASVAYTYTFDAPSTLVGLPDCYSQTDMFTLVGYAITINEPTNFVITPDSVCTMRVAFRHN